MNNLLDLLNKDTLPKPLVEVFVNWCVLHQARPALATVLHKAGLNELSQEIRAARNLYILSVVSQKAGTHAREGRLNAGPFGLYASEATAFLVSKMARAAREQDWDPEGVSFFAAQVCGWAGFASTRFTDPSKKSRAEKKARSAQEAKIRVLLAEFNEAIDG